MNFRKLSFFALTASIVALALKIMRELFVKPQTGGIKTIPVLGSNYYTFTITTESQVAWNNAAGKTITVKFASSTSSACRDGSTRLPAGGPGAKQHYASCDVLGPGSYVCYVWVYPGPTTLPHGCPWCDPNTP